ncbi:MAG: hypothetical protein ACLQHF_09920 [Terracidiphilus sp.]
MAKSIAVRAQPGDEDEPASSMATDTSLTSKAAYDNVESSVRLLSPEANAPRPAQHQSAGLVTMPARNNAAGTGGDPDEPRFNSANWRAEAWERERERELRAAERRPDIVRRRSQQ